MKVVWIFTVLIVFVQLESIRCDDTPGFFLKVAKNVPRVSVVVSVCEIIIANYILCCEKKHNNKSFSPLNPKTTVRKTYESFHQRTIGQEHPAHRTAIEQR